MLKLYAAVGCGSAIVEAVLELLGIDHERVEVEVGYFKKEGAVELRKLNPLAQVPTLQLPDGSVMTESAAIALWLLETHDARHALAPAPGTPDRPVFLRWLIYFVAAIYPMYTVGDVPAEWAGQDAADRLQKTTDERTLACWRMIEDNLAAGDYLLGDRITVLDVYAAVMSRWRPGRARIREVAPRAVAAAERAEGHEVLARVIARNFS